jgi:heme oxygenase
LLRAKPSEDRYRSFLTRLYAFEAPVEERWLVTPDLDRVIDVWRRISTGFLASDLRALGATPVAAEPGPFIGVEQCLGWMYVVERGRRLNGMLRRHLLRRIPDVIETAGAFLTASSSSGSRWDQLGTALDRAAYNHRAAAEQIINAAHRAFRTLRLGPAASVPTVRAA